MGGYYSTILSNNDLNFLRSHTKYSEMALRDWYKKFLAECPGGKMNQRKFSKYYRELYPDGDLINFCGYLFVLTDVKKRGIIDFKEFLHAVNLSSNDTVEDKLRWAFRLSDTDGNGRIDFNEMMPIVDALYGLLNENGVTEWTPQMLESKTKEIFALMDSNQDGFINEREFMVGCMNDKDITNLVLYRKGIVS